MAVFVTGANGYIAKHIIVQLLNKNYQVIGTVRTKEKGDFITKQFNNDNFKYLIVPDYLDAHAFDLIKDYPEISTVIHTAALVNFNADRTSDIIDSAINSTKNILDSIKNFGPNVKSVVLTSSVVSAYRFKNQLPEYNESTWNDVEESDATNTFLAYQYGKTASEKYAWDYVEKNHQNYSFSTILPSVSFGPQAFDNDIRPTLNESAEIINGLVTKKHVADWIKAGNFIDVRDVAKAHIIAFEKNLNQRLILANDEFSVHEIIEIIKSKYPNLDLPSAEKLEITKNINNSKSKKTLGFELIDLKKSVLDTTGQILQST